MAQRRSRIDVGAVLLQAAVLVIVVWLAAELAANAVVNLRRQNIASGFGFLTETAGFGIVQTLIPYDETSSYGRAFVVGLLNTLLVAVIGIVLATAVGVLVGVARLARNWLIARLAALFIEVSRNIPLLLHLFFWYFAVLRQLPSPRHSLTLGEGVFVNNRGLFLPALEVAPAGLALIAAAAAAVLAVMRLRRRGALARTPALGLAAALGGGLLAGGALLADAHLDMPELRGLSFAGGIRIIPELVALMLALTFYTAAYIAEIVRAGIQSVPRGQSEAAFSLGMTSPQVLRLVILPQALRLIIPPLTSQYLDLTKNSSLAVAIAYPDLVSVFTGVALSQIGQAVEVLALIMAVYLALSLITAALMNWFNIRQAAGMGRGSG